MLAKMRIRCVRVERQGRPVVRAFVNLNFVRAFFRGVAVVVVVIVILQITSLNR